MLGFAGDACAKSDAAAMNAIILLEQLGRELGEIVAPDEPRVSASGFMVDDVVIAFPQHFDGGVGRLHQEILFAAPEPTELQTCSRFGVLKRGLELVDPTGVGRRAAETARDAEHPGT